MSNEEDLLRVVEAAYQVDAPDADWLQLLAQSSLPMLDDGFGLCAFQYARGADGLPEIVRSCMLGLPDGLAELHGTIFRTMDPDIKQRPFRMGPCVSGSQLMGGGDALRRHPHMQKYAHTFGMADSLWITAVEPTGAGCGLHAGRAAIGAPSPTVKRRWSHIAAHLSTAARLRRRLRAAGAVADVNAVNDIAVLDPSGRVHHAAGAAKETEALDELRRAVVSLEKTRAPGRRHQPDRALTDWKVLVMARWSLIDQFERGGRRYIVAHENHPTGLGPDALTDREKQVVGRALLGHHNKLIAYELGISHSTVRVLLARAAKRLHVSTRAQLLEACARKEAQRQTA
jgi:DNA-binding CsgD family transcriptional regulator